MMATARDERVVTRREAPAAPARPTDAEIARLRAHLERQAQRIQELVAQVEDLTALLERLRDDLERAREGARA